MNKIEKEPSNTYTSVVESVFQVDRSAWNNCVNFIDDNRNIGNPFLSHEFFSCLEESGSVSKETGWISQHILLFEEGNSLIGILPNYLKNHSWGEYIFDQVFANAWENAGGKYYPKLLSAIPFSPVAGERFLIKKGHNRKFVIEKLLAALEDLKKFYQTMDIQSLADKVRDFNSWGSEGHGQFYDSDAGKLLPASWSIAYKALQDKTAERGAKGKNTFK